MNGVRLYQIYYLTKEYRGNIFKCDDIVKVQYNMFMVFDRYNELQSKFDGSLWKITYYVEIIGNFT